MANVKRAVALLSILPFVASAGNPLIGGVGACEVIIDEEKVYDLGGLTRKEDYTLDYGKSGKVYINICQNVRTEIAVEHPEKVGIFYENDDGLVSWGSFNSTPTLLSPLLSTTFHPVLHAPHDSLSLVYSSGSLCPTGPTTSSRYSTHFTFTCDYFGTSYMEATSEDRNEEVFLVRSEDGCTNFVTWKTPWACPVEGEVQKLLHWTRRWIRFFVTVGFTVLIFYGIYVFFRRFRGSSPSSISEPPTSSKIFDILESTRDMIVIIGIFTLDKLEALKDAITGPGTWGDDTSVRWKFWRRTGGVGPRLATTGGRGDYWANADRERLLDEEEEDETPTRERFRDDV